MSTLNCVYCQSLIDTVRVKCSVCPEFDLCLQCFACGAEAGPHKKEHDYYVIDYGHLPVFADSDPWSHAEEEILLDAVEQYGYGNWEDVARHLEGRTAADCIQHFQTYYLNGSVGKATFADRPTCRVVDHTIPESGPLSPSLTVPVPPLELSPLEQQSLGYMPLRDDFERECDNEAETLVSSLAINYDDEDLDIAFKIAQVDMYRHRLKERLRRKHLARDYGLIPQFLATPSNLAPPTKGKSQPKDKDNKKKNSKDDKHMREKLKVFAQFQPPKEHTDFCESLQKEKQLKSRIKECMRYRRNGITKMDEYEEFEAERLWREKKREQRKKMGSLGTMKRTSMVSKKAEVKKEDEEEGEIIIGIGGDGGLNGSKDVTCQVGQDLLSDRERRLINSLGMKPASYITIKTCIIKDYLQRRQGIPIKIRYPSHLDKTHRRKILNFLSENGWIGVVH